MAAAGAVRRHGWFEVAGIQSGEHTIKARLPALPHIVRQRAKGATILDLGCAEGLLSKWLIDHCQARLAHGVECHTPFIDMGQKLCAGVPVTFFQADLDHFDVWRELNPDALLPKYDIVMALCIAQKMTRPERFLREAANLCGDLFVLQTPAPVIEDHRSGMIPVDVAAVLAQDFDLAYSRKAESEYYHVYKRKVVANV